MWRCTVSFPAAFFFLWCAVALLPGRRSDSGCHNYQRASGFGHNENSRVIGMIKPRSIETTYKRVQKERNTSSKVIPVSQEYHYTSDPATPYLSSAILFPRRPCLTGVSQHRLMRPGYGPQNTTLAPPFSFFVFLQVEPLVGCSGA